MITMMVYSTVKKEFIVIKKQAFEVICRISDEDWNFENYSTVDKLKEFLSTKPVIDISCIDVTAEDGVSVAEEVRRENKDMCMIVISDLTVPPTSYIKPSVMASSLLLRPITEINIEQVLTDAMSAFFRDSDKNKKSFIIDNRDGRQLIPYDRIFFFESRAKKIFVCTDGREYSFYDTLDGIEQKLDDSFIRCHRSYIVARSQIRKIIFSQNIIELINGDVIPISRSYKPMLKELK